MIVKKSFLSSKTTSKLQQRFKIEKQNVNTEEVNKIGLSSNDLKRLQTFDKAKLYPMLQMLENMESRAVSVSKYKIINIEINESKIEHNPS